jgi:bacterioferritin-associated ferredoxin
MYICLCNGVTERQIRECAAQGACSLKDLEHCLGVGAGCGRCGHVAKEVLRDSRLEVHGAVSASPA